MRRNILVSQIFLDKSLSGGQYVETLYTAFLRRLDVAREVFVKAFKKATKMFYDMRLVRPLESDENFQLRFTLRV